MLSKSDRLKLLRLGQRDLLGDDLVEVMDAEESERRKREGMQRAAERKAEKLEFARKVAVSLALNNPDRETNTDEVSIQLRALGRSDNLGPAAGSIFKCNEWECTGRFVKSARVSNHSRLIRVWKLKQ